MPESGAAILIRISKRKFIAKWIFLQKAKGVTDAYVEIGFGKASPGLTKSEPSITNRSVLVPDSSVCRQSNSVAWS